MYIYISMYIYINIYIYIYMQPRPSSLMRSYKIVGIPGIQNCIKDFGLQYIQKSSK